MIRPENMPEGSVGVGSVVVTLDDGTRLAAINVIGRTFMKPYDCPFRAVDRKLEELKDEADIILVDFHAEATSEKMAMGHYVSGRASACWGTHTHVPTSDGRVLADYTGYVTDLGMTGAYDSVIGMKKEAVIEGFITLERTRFEVAKEDPRLGGAIFRTSFSMADSPAWRDLPESAVAKRWMSSTGFGGMRSFRSLRDRAMADL